MKPIAVNQHFDFTGGEAVAHQVHGFATNLAWEDVPIEVRERVKLLLLDLIGVLACGSETEVSRIVRQVAVDHYGPGATSATLPFDGRRVSPTGAAFATGTTIDAIDGHDGHRLVKGHVGCGIMAALLGFADDLETDNGTELLTALLIGYEIGTRAGRVMHESPLTGPQYHSSGSWVALACATIGARLMAMDVATFRHAVAIADYHGPRSPIMKVVANPSMLKDGSGWGAMTGVSAAYMARAGFTGAPSNILESAPIQPYWADLGQNWEVLNQYVKPQPVCRWAQPATQAAADLKEHHGFEAADVAGIEVETFEEATLLSQRIPNSTEEAQYNVAFPLATLLVKGQVGAAEVTDTALFANPEIVRLAGLVKMVVRPDLDHKFPAERWAVVRVTLRSGVVHSSEPTEARGDPDTMLQPEEFRAKFHLMAGNELAQEEREELIWLVDSLDRRPETWPRIRQLLNGRRSSGE